MPQLTYAPPVAPPARGPTRAGRTWMIMLIVAAAVALGVAPIIIRRFADWTGTGVHCTSGPGRSRWSDQVPAAARVGAADGLRTAVAVVDTATGACYTAGDTHGLFATASVVKVMIAAYLLDTGQMSGDAADLAYSMITRSDDDAANTLWSQAGAAGLEPWIESHYRLPGLGSANEIPGRWGNTHVTAAGLALLYAKLKADPAVWPWLGNAMHHMRRIAKDGTDQAFGIAAIAKTAAVKQGWAAGSADDPDDAVVNTTGYVAANRYAVVVLTEGRHNNAEDGNRSFNAAQAATVTAMTRQLDVAAPR